MQTAGQRLPRRTFLALGMGLAVAGCGEGASRSTTASEGAAGSGYPKKPIEFVTAGEPGGGLDIFARAVDEALSKSGIFKGTMTITNLGGGGGNTTMAVGRSRSGSAETLLGNSNRVYLNPLVGTTDLKLGKDFVPIAQLMTEYLALTVRKDSPYQTAKDVAADLKKDPTSVTFGVGTVPSDDQLNVLQAGEAAGVDPAKLKVVAFRSGGDLMTQLLGKRVDAISTGLSEALAQYKNGDVRILAISAEDRQGGASAEIPTWREQGFDIVIEHWRGVFGPAKMPKDAVDYWIDAFSKMTKTSQWKEILKRNEWAPLFRSGDDFAKVLEQEQKTAQRLLASVGLAKS